VNQSNAPGQYDEPEGIFPDGRHTLVESDAHDRRGSGFVDLYRLKLDGTGKDFVRITRFADVPSFKASNPVVSDDGRFIAFQEARSGENAGVGHGLYVLDWAAARKAIGLPAR
jgi:Tol biopolymer transport system component